MLHLLQHLNVPNEMQLMFLAQTKSARAQVHSEQYMKEAELFWAVKFGVTSLRAKWLPKVIPEARDGEVPQSPFLLLHVPFTQKRH